MSDVDNSLECLNTMRTYRRKIKGLSLLIDQYDILCDVLGESSVHDLIYDLSKYIAAIRFPYDPRDSTDGE